jgi:hypothetical protein
LWCDCWGGFNSIAFPHDLTSRLGFATESFIPGCTKHFPFTNEDEIKAKSALHTSIIHTGIELRQVMSQRLIACYNAEETTSLETYGSNIQT